MAATFRSSSSIAWASGSADVTLSKPTGTQDGDLLVAFIVNADNRSVSSAPSGWNQIEDVGGSGGNTHRIICYRKVASGEGSSWTWTLSGTSAFTGAVVASRLAGTTTGASASNGATVSNSDAPSFACTVTPDTTDSLLLLAVASMQSDNNVSGYAVATDNPATWTEAEERIDLGSVHSFGVAYASRPEITATGNASVSGLDATADSTAVLVAVPRQTAFTSSNSETVTASDVNSVRRDRVSSNSDTVTVTDVDDVAKSRAWSNDSKNSATWTDEAKH